MQAQAGLDLTQPVGLALGGGAARGWAHVGVIHRLQELGVSVSSVAGTSIGALIGAFVATGKLECLLDQVENYRQRDWLKLFDPGLAGDGLVAGRRVEQLLADHFGDTRIESLTLPFAAIAVDLASGQELRLTTGSLVDAVRASIAIPGLLRPLYRNGQVLVDGGLANPVPVDAARELGARQVLAVGLNRHLPASFGSLPAAAAAPVTGLQRLTARIAARWRRPSATVVAIAQASLVVIEQQLTLARLRQAAPELLIEPDLSSIELADFHRGKTAIAIGYQAACQALPTT